MRFILIPAILVASTAAVSATPAAAAHHPSAKTIVLNMLRALDRQQRVQTTGHIKIVLRTGGKKHKRTTSTSSTQYRLRYQASGREELDVGPTRSSGNPAARPQVVRYIFIGNKLYTSLDGHRWVTLANRAPATEIDALGVGLSGATCCTSSGLRTPTRVTFKRATTYHRHQVYVINYLTASSTGGASGKLVIDRHSLLPIHYTARVQPSNGAGSFNVTYGGKFNISAPKT